MALGANCRIGNGQYYRGPRYFSENGTRCQPWSLNGSYNPTGYRYSDLISNYCRNPVGARSRPWCYGNTARYQYVIKPFKLHSIHLEVRHI
ncbi:uncharacterized protein TRIADDRAFT_29648 [Trichoplax adhaerens]|uniref:Kringle domain-containing protein n=1 Tax=Trichoplax adhaerens TaxID=10228 RepID=B3S5U6_TRIAD|nr:hypothetical protein TRIADDRAFT_29648 [Trichoplax adhaerens]EDV21855.1 hypothetical protein TRIADDRAFT_29648 [Trichoplax adhaerens]|eukprot:XP_002115492.1 hypothetical protein TRIADDRAFT_29648 [Trichoplax adhaerens]